jgi:hypothetical protein
MIEERPDLHRAKNEFLGRKKRKYKNLFWNKLGKVGGQEGSPAPERGREGSKIIQSLWMGGWELNFYL